MIKTMKQCKIYLIIILCILNFHYSCDSQTIDEDKEYGKSLPAHVLIERKNGIEHVHNSRIPFRNKKLELELIIGDSETSGIYFSAVPIVKEDHDGNIYIGDYNERSITKLNNKGEFIQKIGRPGGGPGEFGFGGPRSLGFYSDNQMLVSDRNAYRFHLFNTDGKCIDVFTRYDHMPGRILIDQSDVRYEKAKIYTQTELNSEINTKRHLIQKVNREFEIIGYVGNLRNYSGNYSDRMTQLMNAASIAVDKEGQLYLSYIYDNLIQIYRKDTLFKEISRDLHFDPVEPRLTPFTMEEFPKLFGLRQEIDQITDRICCDSFGNIYVLSHVQGKKSNEKNYPKSTRLLEVFNNYGWLIHNILITNISPDYMYIGKGNKIYLNDKSTYRVLRYKAIF